MQISPTEAPKYTLDGLFYKLHGLSLWFRQKKQTGKMKYIKVFHEHLSGLCHVFINELIDELLANKIQFKEGDMVDGSFKNRDLLIFSPLINVDLLLNETIRLEKSTLKFYDSMIDEGNLSFRTSKILQNQRAILKMSLKEIEDLEIKYKCYH